MRWILAPLALGSLGAAPPPPPGLDHDAIEAGVKARMDQVRMCYGRAEAKDPRPIGKIVVDLVIEIDGAVESAVSVPPGIDRPELTDCVLHEFEQMRFPSHPVSTSVRYPLIICGG